MVSIVNGTPFASHLRMIGKHRLGRALANPSAEFALPADVLDARSIAPDQKAAILRSWQDEVVQLMRASDENMVHEGDACEIVVAERLSAVRSALTALTDRTDPSAAHRR